jgi:hypothetical protein
MPRVFVPHQPSRLQDGLWIPTINLDPAKEWGEVVIMLPPQANRLQTANIVKAMKERMGDFNEDDYLVAVGDPTLLAAAAMIASRKTGGVTKLLKWDRIANGGSYICTEIEL